MEAEKLIIVKRIEQKERSEKSLFILAFLLFSGAANPVVTGTGN